MFPVAGILVSLSATSLYHHLSSTPIEAFWWVKYAMSPQSFSVMNPPIIRMIFCNDSTTVHTPNICSLVIHIQIICPGSAKLCTDNLIRLIPQLHKLATILKTR